MEALIPQLIAAIPTAALPLVFVIVACWFIYWKIQSQRKETKKTRDEAHDNIVTRVTLLEREIEEIKQLDLATKLAQIQTDLNWIKEKLK
jgi:hypothetical protein